jgi:hypothetical protein
MKAPKQKFHLHHVDQLLACKQFVEVVTCIAASEFSPRALAVAQQKLALARPYLSNVRAI